MGNEKRRNQRKSIERRAWIDCGDGSPLVLTSLGNMSETGAKLVFTEPAQLPAEFVLQLSVDGRVARKCRLAWTDGNFVGVQFTAKLVAGAARAMESIES
jgi:hypothetical protein